jgi:hypothetical protein
MRCMLWELVDARRGRHEEAYIAVCVGGRGVCLVRLGLVSFAEIIVAEVEDFAAEFLADHRAC